MCIYSKFWVQWEKKNLAPYAVHSDHPFYSYRSRNDTAESALDGHGSRSRYSTAFEIDKDRIANSQAFRRLEYKTQVFVTHEGDNFRTRLTHTLEVSEIARHIARALRLNEHLVEAIALGHDLGHPPFGHTGEKAINSWIQKQDNLKSLKENYYFCHNRHSVENVEHLEPGYDWDDRERGGDEVRFGHGLNLTIGVREGMLTHTNRGYRGPAHQGTEFEDNFEKAIKKLSKANSDKGLLYPGSLESQVVRVADELAQRIHDLEDGLRSKMLEKENIINELRDFFSIDLNNMFDNEKITKTRYLEHSCKFPAKIKISKSFIDEIVKMKDLKGNDKDPNSKGKGKQPYCEIKDSVIDREINSNLETDSEYREDFLLVAKIAFLLHMWLDDNYLDNQTKEEQERARTRILKYFKFLQKILIYKDGSKEPLPTYHIVAFLRGIMLSNVIEHSFRNIHRLLDSNFKVFRDSAFYKPSEGLNVSKLNKQWYLIFVLVDGLTYKTNGIKPHFEKADDEKKYFCFQFKNETEINDFVRENFKDILITNGRFLKSVKSGKKIRLLKLKKINWLNKSENPEATEYVKITTSNGETRRVPIEQIRIYFTGYKDLCPGVKKVVCSFATPNNSNCEGCEFKADVKDPDINKLIEFQEYMEKLDSKLKNLIEERIHRGSRVARMNYMGEKIINDLLDTYSKYPRIMHDRVWSRLRIYKGMEGVSPEINQWVNQPIPDKEKLVISQMALDCLTNTANANAPCNQYSLIRRIIDHIAGMTDRYISNEFNRINQGGRETELQDETYFFS